jgi:hypothetical protein
VENVTHETKILVDADNVCHHHRHATISTTTTSTTTTALLLSTPTTTTTTSQIVLGRRVGYSQLMFFTPALPLFSFDYWQQRHTINNRNRFYFT